MSVESLLREAQSLPQEEQKQLIKALVDLLAPASARDDEPIARSSLREFRGVGARLYDGTDAQVHINALRDEWDERS